MLYICRSTIPIRHSKKKKDKLIKSFDLKNLYEIMTGQCAANITVEANKTYLIWFVSIYAVDINYQQFSTYARV